MDLQKSPVELGNISVSTLHWSVELQKIVRDIVLNKGVLCCKDIQDGRLNWQYLNNTASM